MANISDYLDWRGDIDFATDPFNEVDNLILSELAYVDFDDIVPAPGSGKPVTIQKVYRDFFSRYSEEEILARQTTTKMAPFLMEKLIHSRRFGNMMLDGFVNEIDFESQSQFSAVLFYLGDGTVYVAYRGTDNTIVGWKEDFNMGFLCHTPGQQRAVAYLNDCSRSSCRRMRVGGHSKGGNFAVYAAAFCDEDVRRRILQVYSNDGPGFLPEIVRSAQYQAIRPKVRSTIPEASIVGMLLENDLEDTVVKSSQYGAYQHDALSWEVQGNRFVRAENLSDSSVFWDRTITNWLMGISKEDREEFVDVVFGVLEATGATTFDELSEAGLWKFGEMRRYISDLPVEKQRAVVNILLKLALCGRDSFRKMLRRYFGGSMLPAPVTENKNKRKNE